MKNYSMFVPLVLPIFLLFLSSGCATGFHSELAYERLCTLKPDRPADPGAGFQTPVRLAIYLDMESMDSYGNIFRRWDWTNKNEKLSTEFLNQLIKKRIVSEYFFLPRNQIPPQNIGEIFAQAEKDGAEALLQIRSVAFVDKYFNPAGILDLTLIGAMWFPGSNRDAYILVRGDFWDMRSKNLEFTVWGDVSERISAPTFTIDSRDALEKAEKTGLMKMIKGINSQTHPCFDLKWN